MCQLLHTLVDPNPNLGSYIDLERNILIEEYALGWRCNEDEATQQLAAEIGGGDVICVHDGSVNYWFAKMYILPGRDRAFIAATNDIRATDLVYGVQDTFLSQTDEFIEIFSNCTPIDQVKEFLAGDAPKEEDAATSDPSPMPSDEEVLADEDAPGEEDAATSDPSPMPSDKETSVAPVSSVTLILILFVATVPAVW